MTTSSDTSFNSLLDSRICDLNISICNKRIQSYIAIIKEELKIKNITLNPIYFISDEWFCYDSSIQIGIPFYLFSNELMEIEKFFIGYAEGGYKNEFLKLLRHEIAHAIDNAYSIRKSKTRQKLFGLTSTPYPSSYHPITSSKSFVQNLSDNYAQAHPDEDWAETFAVWLDPNSDWKNKYNNWPAIKKIKLVDDLMSSLPNKRPLLKKVKAEVFSITLRDYYKQKLNKIDKSCRSFFANPIKSIFIKKSTNLSAYEWILNNKQNIQKILCNNNNLYKHDVERVLSEISRVCREKKLYVTQVGNLDNNFIDLFGPMINNYIKNKHNRIIM